MDYVIYGEPVSILCAVLSQLAVDSSYWLCLKVTKFCLQAPLKLINTSHLYITQSEPEPSYLTDRVLEWCWSSHLSLGKTAHKCISQKAKLLLWTQSHRKRFWEWTWSICCAGDVKLNPTAPSLTTGFICQMHGCVAIQMYNSCFCSFCAERSLPAAYFLRPAPSSVPLTAHHKAAACETRKAFCPISLSPSPASRWRTIASGFPGQCGGA